MAASECICDNYPIPKTEDLFRPLFMGGEKFHQIRPGPRHTNSCYSMKKVGEVLTVNTHRGLFEAYTIAIRSEFSNRYIFREKWIRDLSHIPFVKVRVDDILISGVNDDEHFKKFVIGIKNFKREWITW